jgi:hypothetical protein
MKRHFEGCSSPKKRAKITDEVEIAFDNFLFQSFLSPASRLKIQHEDGFRLKNEKLLVYWGNYSLDGVIFTFECPYKMVVEMLGVDIWGSKYNLLLRILPFYFKDYCLENQKKIIDILSKNQEIKITSSMIITYLSSLFPSIGKKITMNQLEIKDSNIYFFCARVENELIKSSFKTFFLETK